MFFAKTKTNQEIQMAMKTKDTTPRQGMHAYPENVFSDNTYCSVYCFLSFSNMLRTVFCQ
jgi:hypothetical protein